MSQGWKGVCADTPLDPNFYETICSPPFPPIWNASLVPDQLSNTFLSKKLPLPPKALPTPLTQVYTPISLNLRLVLITPRPCTLSHCWPADDPFLPPAPESLRTRITRCASDSLLSSQVPSMQRRRWQFPFFSSFSAHWVLHGAKTPQAQTQQSQELVKKTTCSPV